MLKIWKAFVVRRFVQIIIVIITLTGYTVFSSEVDQSDSSVKARVMHAENMVEGDTEKQNIKAAILEGEFKDSLVEIERNIVKNSFSDFKLRTGDEIYVFLNVEDNKLESASLSHVSRERSIKILVVIFICAMLLFGVKKGLASVLSLVFSGIMIIKVFIPWVIQGKDPITCAILVTIIIITVSFIIISGFSRKTLSAITGTVMGTLLAGAAAAYFTEISCITGVVDDYTQFLITERGMDIDYKGLLFSGIIFGTMGAVMDVSMSITSVIYEIKKTNPKASFVDLVVSGFRVGKDILATMVDTLILAYAATALPLMLFFVAMERQTSQILNFEDVAIEIIRSLCGGLGIIFTVPFTSIFAAVIAVSKGEVAKKRKRERYA